MNKTTVSVMTLFAAGLLSACSSTPTATHVDPFEGTVAILASAGEEGENLTEITTDDLPDSAAMSGYLGVGLSDNDTIFVGSANATADFSAGTLVGEATGFGEYSLADECDESFEACSGTLLQEIDGTIDIDGEITETNFTYTASGDLTGSDDGVLVTGSMDIDGAGGFGEVDGALTAIGLGEGTATLTSSEGSQEADALTILILQE